MFQPHSEPIDLLLYRKSQRSRFWLVMRALTCGLAKPQYFPKVMDAPFGGVLMGVMSTDSVQLHQSLMFSVYCLVFSVRL